MIESEAWWELNYVLRMCSILYWLMILVRCGTWVCTLDICWTIRTFLLYVGPSGWNVVFFHLSNVGHALTDLAINVPMGVCLGVNCMCCRNMSGPLANLIVLHICLGLWIGVCLGANCLCCTHASMEHCKANCVAHLSWIIANVFVLELIACVAHVWNLAFVSVPFLACCQSCL